MGKPGFPIPPPGGRVWEGYTLPRTTVSSLRRCAADSHGHLQVKMVQHFNMGWYKCQPDPIAARRLVDQHRLLNIHQLRALFPEAVLIRERVLGLTKSFIVYGGWDMRPDVGGVVD